MPLSKEELEQIIAKAKADADNPIRKSPEIIDIGEVNDVDEVIEHVCGTNCNHKLPLAVLQVLQKRMKRLENQKKKKTRR